MHARAYWNAVLVVGEGFMPAFSAALLKAGCITSQFCNCTARQTRREEDGAASYAGRVENVAPLPAVLSLCIRSAYCQQHHNKHQSKPRLCLHGDHGAHCSVGGFDCRRLVHD